MRSTTKADFDKPALQRLVDATLGSTHHIRTFNSIDTGYFNSVYRLNLTASSNAPETVIIRIGPHKDQSVLTHEQGIMPAEVSWYQMLERHPEIPVPRLLAHDTSDDASPRHFMILEDAHGVPLNDIEPALSDHQRRIIHEDFGSVIRKLHGITSNYFGYPHVPNLQGDSWPDVFLQMIKVAIEDIARLNDDVPKIVQEFSSETENFLELLPNNPRPSLIHWDLTGHNVFVDPEALQVSAIIDWERAFWGLPEAEHHWSFAPEAFFDGYGRPRRSDSLARKQQTLYAAYVTLIVLAEAPRRGASEDVRQAIQNLTSRLDALRA